MNLPFCVVLIYLSSKAKPSAAADVNSCRLFMATPTVESLLVHNSRQLVEQLKRSFWNVSSRASGADARLKRRAGR
jgi:hypothetical protein